MDFKKVILISSLIIFCNINILKAQVKYSNEFLAIGVDAKALGMSNTVASFSNDVTAGYWNPAGLAKIEENMQFSFMHAQYFAGIANYNYAAAAFKLDDQSSFGISYIRFGVDDIPNTTELIDADGNIDYDRITTFSAIDNGLLFSYSRLSNIEGLSYGANVKVVHRTVGDFGKSWGFGIDLGAQYDLNKWHFGIVGKDITSTFNAWSYTLSDEIIEIYTQTNNEIPESSIEITVPKLILAASRSFEIGEKFGAIAAIDFDITFDGKRNTLLKSDFASIDPHFGFEINYNELIFLRAGIGNIQTETDFDGSEKTTFQPNMGVGINIRNKVIIDYALTDIGDQSVALYSNIFSIKINIDQKL